MIQKILGDASIALFILFVIVGLSVSVKGIVSLFKKRSNKK